MSRSANEDVAEPQAERDIRPVIELPRAGLPGAAIAGFAALGAIGLFVVVDAQRRSGTVDPARAMRTTTDAFVAPPPLDVPREINAAPMAPEQLRPPVIVSEIAPPPRIAPPIVQQLPAITGQPLFPSPTPQLADVAEPQRTRTNDTAPALVYDGGEEIGSPTSSLAQASPSSSGTPPAPGGQRASIADTPARASVIGNRATTMPTGTLIPAVLETPIDTARPGLVRAIVSEDARGFDGSRVLVPRGARLIGEYQADVRSGQNRVLVTWARLIRPDGATISLGSPASDPLGGAGVPGRVNNFFFERFAGAVLQSALNIGVNLASRPGNGSVIVGLPTGQVNSALGQGLVPNDLRPKIKVRQGAKVNVFVARDLDFSGVPTKR